MTRTEERGLAILELFAEAQRLVDLDNRLTRLTEIERHRKTEVANRYHKPAASRGAPLSAEEKRARRLAARKTQRQRVKAEIAALRAARKAAA